MAGSRSEMVSSPSVQIALDTARDDDNALVLTVDQIKEVGDFRDQLQRQTNDDKRLQLCAEKWSELLQHDTQLQFLIATYDDVMSAACSGYNTKKQAKTSRTPQPTRRNKKTDDDAERGEWDRYFSAATSAAGVKSQCLAALKAVAGRWGKEVVQHYPWASKGERFWNLLRAAAIHIPTWHTAAQALNTIMFQRHKDIKRTSIAYSHDRITAADLMELKALKVFGMLESLELPSGFALDKLPSGFVLDKFGIIAHQKSDRQVEPSDAAGDPDLSDPPETDMEPSGPHTGPQTEADHTMSQPPSVPTPPSHETNSPNQPTGMSLRERMPISYKGCQGRSLRTRSTPSNATQASPISASIAPEAPPPPCCPVPSTLLGTLDGATTFKPENFTAILSQLCPYHTRRLLEQVWTKALAADQARPTVTAHSATRRRAASQPDITRPFKRQQLEEPILVPSISAHIPQDQEAGEDHQTQAALQYLICQLPLDSRSKQPSMPPNTGGGHEPIDAVLDATSAVDQLAQQLAQIRSQASDVRSAMHRVLGTAVDVYKDAFQILTTQRDETLKELHLVDPASARHLSDFQFQVPRVASFVCKDVTISYVPYEDDTSISSSEERSPDMGI